MIRRLAEAFRVRSALRDGLHGRAYKTAQRYFAGERIEPETGDAILAALVDAAIPHQLRVESDPDGGGRSLRHHVLDGLRYYARRWDRFVADVNTGVYPVTSPADLPIPVLRLVVLDVGLRHGCWLALQEVLGRTPPPVPPSWLDSRSLRTLMDELREEGDLTVEELADRVGVSAQTIESWRGGASLPTNEHIEQLAKALSGEAGDRVRIEYRIRLAVGCEAIYRGLTQLCGESRIQDMIEALVLTAIIIRNSFIGPLHCDRPPGLDLETASEWRRLRDSVDEWLPPRLWNVVIHGAACPVGAGLAQQMSANTTLRPDVAADFRALPGDWVARCQHWMQFLGSVPNEMAHLKSYAEATGAFPVEFAEGVGPSIVEERLRMARFDGPPSPEHRLVRLRLPPDVRGLGHIESARRAEAVGDLRAAIAAMRAAVGLEPTSAVRHFYLGCYLWQHAWRDTHDIAGMEEGLLECHLAVQFDSEFGNARNEIGIILSNLRRHEEAEVAFAEAEPYFGEHAHHWLARGNNYLGLKRYEEARAAFEKAIDRTKDGAHVEAKAQLAATLMALDRKREARRLGKRVKHLIGADPTEQWESVLDVWRGCPFGIDEPPRG